MLTYSLNFAELLQHLSFLTKVMTSLERLRNDSSELERYLKRCRKYKETFKQKTEVCNGFFKRSKH